MSKIQIVSIIFNIGIILVILNLFRKKRLKEKYSILWLLGGFSLLFLSFFRPLLESIASFFGVYYPPSILFLFAFSLVVVILLHFSVAISDLEKKIRSLLEMVVLLEEKLINQNKETKNANVET